MNVEVGDYVTCKEAVEAYGSAYGDQPFCEFAPYDEGVVVAVDVPYVTPPSEKGRGDSFVCIEFWKKNGPVYNAAHGGSPWRAALSYNNIVIVEKGRGR